MNLYLRLLWALLRCWRLPALQPTDTLRRTFRVLPNDLDINGHMNNGRYMTIADLALVEYFTRSGFLRVVLHKGWRPMLGGAMISFRRGLRPFSRYRLRFQVLGWDARWSYMRFEFQEGGRTMAVGHAKGAIVASHGIVHSSVALAALGRAPESPPLPPALLAWIEADRLLGIT